jgi:hypothetical protein
MEMDRQCFVISPINLDDPDCDANLVYQELIIPACRQAKFNARRSDEYSSDWISADMMTALHRAPRAIAYLGAAVDQSAPLVWNPNVMFEVGYRIARRMPLVILTENPTKLPFDLRDRRSLQIPSGETLRAARVQNETPEKIVAAHRVRQTIARIAEVLERPLRDGRVFHNRTSATMSFLFPRGKPFIRWYSSHADTIFDLSSLKEATGKEYLDATEVLNRFIVRMPEAQRRPFVLEQRQIQAELNDFSDVPPVARVCLVFPDLGHGVTKLLPIVTRFVTEDSDARRLDVVYVDVSNVATAGPDGVYKAYLESIEGQ